LRFCYVQRLASLVILLGADYLGREQALSTVELRLGEHQRGLALLPRGNPRPHECDLVIDVFDRTGKFETLTPHLTHQTSHSGLCHDEIRLSGVDRCLFDRDLNLIWLRVKFDEHFAYFHAIVIVDQNACHLTADARRNEGHIAVHIRVVGRDRVQRTEYAWNAD
jgi:hypothetical protein